MVKVLFQAKKITFIHEFGKSQESLSENASSTTLSAPEPSYNRPSFHIYPPKDALTGEIRPASYHKVNARRAIEISWYSGHNHIYSCEARLVPGSAGLRLYTAEATKVGGDLSITEAPQPGHLHFSGPMHPFRSASFRMPYDLEHHSTSEIAVGLELTYVTDAGTFRFLTDAQVATELPFAVNVHDVFKAEALFCRFRIRAAAVSEKVPVELVGVELEGTQEFVVTKPPAMALPVDVLPTMPYWATFKIEKRDGRRSNDEKRGEMADRRGSSGVGIEPLSLVIRYRHFTTLVMERVEAVFCAELEKSAFEDLKYLLLPRLLRGVVESLVNGDSCAEAAMMNELAISPYEAFRWREIFNGLEKERAKSLMEWLRGWHKSFATLELRHEAHEKQEQQVQQSSSSTCEVVIEVPVPVVDVLNSVSLKILKKDDLQKPAATDDHASTPMICNVGEVLAAEIEIRHTRRWAGCGEQRKSSLSATRSNNSKTSSSVRRNSKDVYNKKATEKEKGAKTKALGFVYDINADPETWLIAGSKRKRFSAQEGQVFRSRVFLIPVRTGRVLLPRVEVTLHKMVGSRRRRKFHDAEEEVDQSGEEGDSDEEEEDDDDDDDEGTGNGSNGNESSDSTSEEEIEVDKMRCETDYLSQAETVMVIENWKSGASRLRLEGGGGAKSRDGVEGGPRRDVEVNAELIDVAAPA